jgi:hypothetical protein
MCLPRRWRKQHEDGNEIPAASHRGGTGLAVWDWSVCWLGGWQKHRLSYLVMLVKLKPRVPSRQSAPARTALPSPKDSAFNKPHKKAPPAMMARRRFVL